MGDDSDDDPIGSNPWTDRDMDEFLSEMNGGFIGSDPTELVSQMVGELDATESYHPAESWEPVVVDGDVYVPTITDGPQGEIATYIPVTAMTKKL